MRKILPFISMILLWGCAATGVNETTVNPTQSDQGSKKVTRIRDDFVLIGTDQSVGEVNEIVRIQRLTDQGVVNVGAVQIARFRDGLTAARIVSEESGMHIQVGDFVEGYLESEAVATEETKVEVESEKQSLRKRMKYLALVFVSSILITIWISGRNDAP
jgi:hypothetical protein